MTAVVVAVAMVALVYVLYMIIREVRYGFEESDNTKDLFIKEISEEKHDNPTPQQLVDFFNRPHP